MDINPVTASLYSTAQLQEIEFTDQKVQPAPKELQYVHSPNYT